MAGMYASHLIRAVLCGHLRNEDAARQYQIWIGEWFDATGAFLNYPINQSVGEANERPESISLVDQTK